MKADPIFKERFGITTPIRYVPSLVVDPKVEEAYKKAWKKFQKETEPCGSLLRRKRFDRFLRQIEEQQDDALFCTKVEIRYINDQVGFGVFAKEKIAPATILTHYAGILKLDEAISTSNDSTFTFSDFPLFAIDGQKAGNWARFMNHSPEKHKSTNVVAWEHYSQWGPRIVFTACRRGIQKGEQLLYSYGDSYWEEDGFLPL